MLVSCFTNSYGRFGAKAAIENVRAAGLEHVELPIRTAGVASLFGDEPLLTQEADADDLKRVDELLALHGVTVSSCNVSSGNPLERSATDLAKRKLDVAKHFGVDVVVGGAGEVEDEAALGALYSHLREIGDHAAGLGMTYCFETHPGICVNHRFMLKTMHDLNHPNLRLNFDTGNLHYYNVNANVEVALAKVCPFVKHLHLKDSTGEPGDWYFAALGLGGAVDFLRVLQIMRDVGFSGPFSIELEGIRGEGDVPFETVQRRVADSVQLLRDCGYFE